MCWRFSAKRYNQECQDLSFKRQHDNMSYDSLGKYHECTMDDGIKIIVELGTLLL